MNKLISKIIEEYSLDSSVKYISKVRKGYLTNNFIIGNSRQRFFLKQYSDNQERIKKTHKAKFLFFKKGIPIIVPHKTKNGKSFIVKDEKCYALFPYVKSFQFNRLEMTSTAIMNAGKLLADIHLVTKIKIPKINLLKRNFMFDNEATLDKLSSIKEIILSKKEKTNIDKVALRLIECKKNLIKNSDKNSSDFNLGKAHIIHGDFHEANIFFKKNDTVDYIFDWECVSFAPRTMEIARVLSLMCFNGRFTDKNYANALIFIEAYSTDYPISKSEFSDAIFVQYLSSVYSMWTLEEYYLRNNKKVYKFINDQLRTLNYLSKNMSVYIKRLIN